MAEHLQPGELKNAEKSKHAASEKDSGEHKDLSTHCFEMQVKGHGKAGKDEMKASKGETLGVLADMQVGHLPHDGRELAHVRETLNAMGVKLGHFQNAKDVKEIPGMKELPKGAKIEPGDVIVTGPRLDSHRKDDPGNIGIAIGDGEMANSFRSKIPDPHKVESFKVFRATDSK